MLIPISGSGMRKYAKRRRVSQGTPSVHGDIGAYLLELLWSDPFDLQEVVHGFKGSVLGPLADDLPASAGPMPGSFTRVVVSAWLRLMPKGRSVSRARAVSFGRLPRERGRSLRERGARGRQTGCPRSRSRTTRGEAGGAAWTFRYHRRPEPAVSVTQRKRRTVVSFRVNPKRSWRTWNSFIVCGQELVFFARPYRFLP